MVSKALSGLMDWADGLPVPHDSASPAPHRTHSAPQTDAAALIKELDFLGCKIVLKDGGPVIRGDKAAITPDLLDLLKAGREQIIEHLTAQASPDHEQKAASEPPQPDPLPTEHDPQSGIRRDPETGKLHIFGNPDPRWLKEQGWEWNDQRRRFMAPFPQDREDPPPRFIITASPVKADHRLHADGPCSLCGFTHWWRKAGDTSEGWTCSVCHPAPEGIVTITPQTLITQNSLDATA